MANRKSVNRGLGYIDKDLFIDSNQNYITNGTGDTVIYENMLDKEKTPDGKDNTDVINRMDFKEKNRVTPKQGRAIVFDGHHWHTSGQPKDMGGLRIIMNYNLV